MDNSLVISDLHLTERPRDAYRWELFPWLINICNIIPETIRYLFILGDLTDAKDNHPSVLVNTLVETLVDLRVKCGFLEIIILRGNHDGVDPDCPYFGFLNHVPGIRFIAQPDAMELGGDTILLLPHSRNPERDWADIPMHQADFILLHATIKGAVGENGHEIPGAQLFNPMRVKRTCEIYAGDVHVPQRVGRVEYVGAPHHVKFGDKFDPRALLFIAGDRQTDIPIPGVRKHLITLRTINDLFDILEKFPRGDQVKVRIELPKEEYFEWQKQKLVVVNACRDMGLDLCGLELQKRERPTLKKQQVTSTSDPKEVVRKFGERNKLDKLTLETGLELLP